MDRNFAEPDEPAAQESPSPLREEMERPAILYVAVGRRMLSFAISPIDGELVPRDDIALPERVQYAWPHPHLPILYAACADRSAAGRERPFQICVLARGRDGGLSLAAEPAELSARPIHLCTDPAGTHLLTAFGGNPGIMVHRLLPDGTLGAEKPQAAGFRFGAKPHQVRVLPSGGTAVLVERGAKGFGTPDYRAGSLNVFRFDGDVLENAGTVSPGLELAPRGFNPRHLDFHPELPLAYVALEEQNELAVFRLRGDGFDPVPLASPTTLQNPMQQKPRQDCGTVHMHPQGGIVYTANRNDGYVGGHAGPSWIVPDPVPVFPGGENSISVFRLRPDGLPELVQTADSHGLHPRCFALTPDGQSLVAGNLAPTIFEEQGLRRAVPANLAVFRVGPDGTLTFRRRHDIDTGREMIWWMGIAG